MQGRLSLREDDEIPQTKKTFTWQAEGEGVLVQPEYQGLLQELWARQTAALERASPASAAAAAEAREGAAKQLHELQEQPSWVCLHLHAFSTHLSSVFPSVWQ